jgi:hypothetical protein
MDTVTLELRGDDIRIDAFARAIDHFSLLIGELSRAAGAEGLRWEIASLQTGSATTQIRAIPDGTGSDQVDEVVRSYLEVGRALCNGVIVPFSPEVQRHAEAMAAVLDEGVEGVLFETPEDEALVTQVPGKPNLSVPVLRRRRTKAYGAVTGKISTLSDRKALSFTIYDRLNDRAVRCYLRKGQEGLVADMWRKNATVIGIVTRDGETGQAENVRGIEAIEPLTAGRVDGYLGARGSLKPGDGLPEDRIRRMRDAS